MDASSPSPATTKNAGTWRLTVSDACVGSGICSGIARRYFRLGENNRTQPVHAEITADDVVLDAVVSCPMEAIRVTDAETGEVLEP